jgi:hypothetical protein
MIQFLIKHNAYFLLILMYTDMLISHTKLNRHSYYIHEN